MPTVAMVTLTPPMASVMVGQQIQLAATTTYTNGNTSTAPVIWASNNTAVATVNATGLVMALTLGQVTITATSDGQSGTSTLTTTTGIVFATVSTGSNHTCGLTPSGAAYCWGDNSSGQLGNGTMTNSATPMPVSGTLNLAMVTAGGDHTCGATAGGAAYCWGDNSSGQLGNGTTTNSAIPVAVSGGHSYYTVSAGTKHTCGVAGSGLPNPPQGQIYCWGDNSSGQLGNGTMTDSSVPVLLAGGLQWNGPLSAGSTHTCAIALGAGFPSSLVDQCWGDNSSGQLGNGTTTNSAVPVYVSAGVDFLSAGTGYSCAGGNPAALTAYLSCWGNNSSGQLGNGTMTNTLTPVSVSGGLTIFNSVSTGAMHACGPVIGDANTNYAYCWGDNSSGQLGNGTTTNSSVPAIVSGGLNFAVVSAGGSHTCGVTRNPTAAGAVYCWGDNTYGQLGNSWTTSSSVPVNVAGPQ